jgi:hypothetical protein
MFHQFALHEELSMLPKAFHGLHVSPLSTNAFVQIEKLL